MVAYELIQKLEQLDYFDQLLKGGIIPMHLIDYKMIYEFYVNELNTLKKIRWVKNTKRQAIENTAGEYNISERTVYEIIKKMKS